MRVAEAGIGELQKSVDTLIVIPNQNLFRVANERTTFADAFAMADQVLYSGVACITDLMVKEGLINLDFADVRAIMREMGKAMMGTGEATGEKRAIQAAEAAIANPLLDETSMRGARGLLISITGGNDLTLYEVDEAASRIRQEVDEDANIILGATFDEKLEGVIRVSVVATGIDRPADMAELNATEQRIAETAARLRAQSVARQEAAARLAPPPVVAATPQPVAAPPQPAPVPVAAPIAAQAAPAHQAPPPATELHAEMEFHAAAPQLAYETYVRHATVEAHPAPQATAYAPPAEQILQPQRLPSIEELPLPAQRQVAEQRQFAEPRPAEAPRMAAPVNPVEAKRRTLLDRLSHWGLPRQDEAAAAAPPPPRPAAPAPSPTHAEYAKRVAPPAPQGRLDMHGRTQPSPRQADDDQLEIPAFLRRQGS
jgi:cell division protein FtsZ